MHGTVVHRKLRFGPFELSIGERAQHRKIRRRCASPKAIKWSTHSRRMDPISRSAKPSCQGWCCGPVPDAYELFEQRDLFRRGLGQNLAATEDNPRSIRRDLAYGGHPLRFATANRTKHKVDDCG
jgi:hypothetical protein